MRSALAQPPAFSTSSGRLSDVTVRSRQSVLKSFWQGLVLLGVSFGAFAIGWQMAGPSARVTGACIALDMAKAHGAIDDVKRKRIVHTLTSVSNPHVELFPNTRSELLSACARLQPPAPYDP